MKIKVRNYIFLFIFIFMLFIPTISYFFLKGYINETNTEKRTLAKKPELTFANIAEYPKEFESYFNDNLAYRNSIFNMWRNINYSVFDESLDNRVTVGKDNNNETWLFYSNRSDGDEMSFIDGRKIYSPNEMKATSDRIKNETEKLKNRNIELFYIMIPNKSTVYSDYLPKSVDVKQDAFTDMYKYLKKDGVNNIYYPIDLLKNESQSQETYYRTDTHWNDFGAYVSFDSVLKDIYNYQVFDNISIKPGFTNKFKGDLHGFMGITSELKDNDITVSYPNSDCISLDVTQTEHGPVEVYENSKYSINETLLLVGDSFSKAAIKPLTAAYKKVVRVYLNTTSYTNDFLKEYKPDKVFLIGVERYGVKNIGFLNK